MALDEREYMHEVARYRRPEHEKERQLEALRRRFEAATPEPEERKKGVEIPMPETRAGLVALTVIAGVAMTAVVIWVAHRFS